MDENSVDKIDVFEGIKAFKINFLSFWFTTKFKRSWVPFNFGRIKHHINWEYFYQRLKNKNIYKAYNILMHPSQLNWFNSEG